MITNLVVSESAILPSTLVRFVSPARKSGGGLVDINHNEGRDRIIIWDLVTSNFKIVARVNLGNSGSNLYN